MPRSLRIAQVAPPFERVPPRAYGGTERIVHGLVTELDRRGHEVTTFASGDSVVPGRLIETVPEALRPLGYAGDSLPYMQQTLHEVLARADEFDIIHSHLEWASLLLARVSPVPVATTFHGRLDLPWADALLRHPPAGLVAISENQANTHPDVPWAAVVHNGLRLVDMPFGTKRTDALAFVGRVVPEKRIVEAIDIARKSGRPLRIAAKAGPTGPERDYFERVFRPALKEAGSLVEYLGELDQPDRDQLFAQSYATLMPGSWPEPFGLVLIESLAAGTPVIARRIGALPEILRDGIDGFFGDDVTEMAFKVDRAGDLDRRSIRESVLDRFSVERMTDRYEAVYRALIDGREAEGTAPSREVTDEEGLGEPEQLAVRRSDRMGALSGR
jgi:glycosyltransferase involved in cell wall biosynthesis